MPYQVVQPWIGWQIPSTEGESVMGYIEVYNIDKDGEWTDLDDIPFITVINCQL